MAPDVEEGTVDDVGEGALGIVGDQGTDGVGFGASAPEPAFAAGEVGEVAVDGDLLLDVELPALVGGEGVKVDRLEVANQVDG